MPTGYRLNPNAQMKIEDERAGRLDYVFETSLTVNECLGRIGSKVTGKLSDYETEVRDGILYVSFADPAADTGGLFVPTPQKYAVRFETMGEKTIIRVRYVWDENTINVQYLMREDICAFFMSLFDASVSESENRVWTDSAQEYADKDPLKLHGSRIFWAVAAVFVLLWMLLMFIANMGVR